MDVIHLLIGIPAVVEHGAVAVFEASVRGDLARDDEKVTHQRLVFLRQRVQRGDGFARHHEQVSRGLRVYILQHGAAVVLIDDVALEFAVHYLLEERSVSHGRRVAVSLGRFNSYRYRAGLESGPPEQEEAIIIDDRKEEDVKEKNKKTLMLVISRGGTVLLSKMLADKLIDVPEEPGIMDDIKEAALKAVFTVMAASIASILVRDLTR